jgi:hypothetical protein
VSLEPRAARARHPAAPGRRPRGGFLSARFPFRPGRFSWPFGVTSICICASARPQSSRRSERASYQAQMYPGAFIAIFLVSAASEVFHFDDRANV